MRQHAAHGARRVLAALAMVVLAAACGRRADTAQAEPTAPGQGAAGPYAIATVAGGCFWCMEPPFEHLPGVVAAVSGYTGGDEVNPTYDEVSSRRTGHLEAVQITFDPRVVSYAQILRAFWMSIDPTDGSGQFADQGPQYRTAIFYHDDEQRRVAEASKRGLEGTGIFAAPIATRILPATAFYPAEEYHQDYYKKNESHYKAYRRGSGREGYLEGLWSRQTLPPSLGFEKPDAATLRQRLTPLQYQVTQEEGTERPFANPYWDHHQAGIYVDVVSGEPLFSSADKFDSGTGWPSFTRPLVADNVSQKADRRLGVVRTEVRSRLGDSHLGHVFDDGPPPTGRRYCINSAALRFVPAQDLQALGYGPFLAGAQAASP